MNIPKNRNIAVKVSNEKEYSFLKKLFKEYDSYMDFVNEGFWIYIDLDKKNFCESPIGVNPIKWYPDDNYFILDIRKLVRIEKLKIINGNT